MDKKYWSENALKLNKNPFQTLWRDHSDRINTSLLSRWLPDAFYHRILKTDLFDEYVCAGLYPYLKTKSSSIFGIDLSESIITAMQLKYPEMASLAADILYLPFKEGFFDLIVSNSTIDHFDSKDEIIQSLNEFHRVLKKGGSMILTMDNLDNMVVALRNTMPFKLLNRIGVLPYYVGVTLRHRQLVRILEKIGFKIVKSHFMVHCPRILCIAAANMMTSHASPKGQQRYLELLKAFENLSGWPTRRITGYFTAVKGIKC